jgi:predicted esterase
MRHHRLPVSRTAHFYSIGELGPTTKKIWIVVHGYGMLANYFIKKFERLSSDEVAVVAPDGLSYYYTGESHSRVGASWMTKNHREDEIRDHITYLNLLYRQLLLEIGNNEGVEVNVLGFSQGVSTVCRWVSATDRNIARLILWSGRIPEDGMRSMTQKIKTYYIYGRDDEYKKWLEEGRQRELLQAYFGTYTWKTFNGTHEVPTTVLQTLALRYGW